MGNCVPNRLSASTTRDILTILSPQQISTLHLMYCDLADRIPTHKINMQNFLLFFHKNGYWGQRLFTQFDHDSTQLISEHEFIRGIGNDISDTAKIIKSTERQKISLLFKFFSKNAKEAEGVFFNEFLIMLYNYPKQDLREVLSDRDFIQFELKHHLVPIESGRQEQPQQQKFSPCRSASIANLTRFTDAGYPLNKNPQKQEQHLYQLDDRLPSGNIGSMIGKDVMRSIKSKYKSNQTIIRLKDGTDFVNIKTTNIQQLVKKFARRIFQQAKIDQQYGKLNFEQFHQWISVHKALYQNYYDGFHNFVWEIDPQTHTPRYIISHEKRSEARMILEDKEAKKDGLTTILLYLEHSILVITTVESPSTPRAIICLDGMSVARLYEQVNGFGIQITHRDGIYPQKKIYFKNQKLLLEWMQLLKFYRGQSVQQLYQICEKIGTGKFSVVYRCKHNTQKKEYAIKQIATNQLDSQSKLLIAHQSSIMQIISHPLLLEFKQYLQTKKYLYIVTELVRGNDLFEFVKDYQYLDQYDAAKITQQIIVGIRFLHSFEIVHRDLKPENIMVWEINIQVVLDQQSGEVSNIKIIDFGFSNYLSKIREMTREELLSGTPNYIAPEVLRQETISFKIDNFAIGVVIYFMLTGMLPFNARSVIGILSNTMSGKFWYSQKRPVSPEAKNLIESLLKTKPAQRMSLEEAVKHPWFDILKHPRQQERRVNIRKTLSKELPF